MMAGMGIEGFTRKYGDSRSEAYDRTSRFFHWAIAALVVIQYATKLVPVGALQVFTEDRLNFWHVSIGPTILVLMVFRLVWRLTHRMPSPPDDLPLALHLVSRATHWLLYAILLLVPILGWIAACAYKVTSYFLGLISLPTLVTPSEQLGGQLGQIHGMLAWILLAIVTLHVAGAMYHALVRKDGLLSRMLPS